jgi:hypothetical protein
VATSRVGRSVTPIPLLCFVATRSGKPSSRVLSTTSEGYCARKPMSRSVCGRIHRSPACYHRRKSGRSNRAIMQRPQLEHIIRAAAAITGAAEYWRDSRKESTAAHHPSPPRARPLAIHTVHARPCLLPSPVAHFAVKVSVHLRFLLFKPPFCDFCAFSRLNPPFRVYSFVVRKSGHYNLSQDIH